MFLLQAKKREEILALLRKQRAERIAVRLIALGYVLIALGCAPAVPPAVHPYRAAPSFGWIR